MSPPHPSGVDSFFSLFLACCGIAYLIRCSRRRWCGPLVERSALRMLLILFVALLLVAGWDRSAVCKTERTSRPCSHYTCLMCYFHPAPICGAYASAESLVSHSYDVATTNLVALPAPKCDDTDEGKYVECKPVVVHDAVHGSSSQTETWSHVRKAYARRQVRQRPTHARVTYELLMANESALPADGSGTLFWRPRGLMRGNRSQCRALQQGQPVLPPDPSPPLAVPKKNASSGKQRRTCRGHFTRSLNGRGVGSTGGITSSIVSMLQRGASMHAADTSLVAAAASSTTAARTALTGSGSSSSGSDGNSISSSPVILLTEPSGAIGFGSTLTSFLMYGVFGVTFSAIYVDGVRINNADVTLESPYAVRLASIPAFPLQSTSELLFFNGVETLNVTSNQDCDSFASRPVNITLAYVPSGGGDLVYNTTVSLDGKDGRPLLMRYCTFTPLLLSLSTSVRVMEPWAFHSIAGDPTNRAASQSLPSSPSSLHLSAGSTQRLTLVMHPQHQRMAGHPQQDSEAHIQRFSTQNAPFTYSDVSVELGISEASQNAFSPHASWWFNHSIQVVSHAVPKECMFSNASFLWSVGEITGDLSTATVVRSLDVQQEAYGLFLVLPSLVQVAHTVILPAVFDVAPGNGVRFWNGEWMPSITYYDLKIRGAFPRSTLFVNQDTEVSLHQLRFPKRDDGDACAYVSTAVKDCTVHGAGDGDTLSCHVEVNNDVCDASDSDAATSPDLMDSCGGGVVVDLFLVLGTTSDEAAGAIVNGNVRRVSRSLNITSVCGFPLALAANSVLRLEPLLEAVPRARQFLRAAAAAAASSSSDSAEKSGEAATVPHVDDWVTMRFAFIYHSRRSGIYRVHCDGSAEDMHVSIRPYDNPLTPIHAHCIQSANNSESVFRHAVIDTLFDSQSTLYINASCTFSLSTLLDANATSAAFCGVSLEGVDISFYSASNALLPPYDVYELRIPLGNTASSSSNVSETKPTAYQAVLFVEGATAPIGIVDLPLLSSPSDCYGLPWQIVESVAAHPESVLYGQRWGGLGYAHHAFVVTASNGTRHCHAFIAFHLPPDGASSCAEIKLDVTEVQMAAVNDVVLAQRVFCGSRSYFMDPISALQLRVPLVEVPRLVDLDTVIPDTETGYLVYQYCVEVLFYILDDSGAVGAYAQNGPLIFTLLDTVHTPSEFAPSVRQTVPDSATSLVLGDTLYFVGDNLRYYDSTGKYPLTGTRFVLRLAAVDMEACGDSYAFSSSGFYPKLSVQWVNETTLALPITADVPGGWFNFSITQGETGQVYVYCGLSFRVTGSITSVTTTDVAGTAGGTTVNIRGVNLPMAAPGTKIKLMLGYTNGSAHLRARRCAIIFTLVTRIRCTTPAMSASELAQLAVFTEESEYAYIYWLPVDLTSHFYNSKSNASEVFQSISVDTVDDGVSLLSVKFYVSKMTVTDVWPLDVSRMEGNPTFHISGTGIGSHSVLLCDVATINAGSTPEKTSCILCLPRSFSATELVCDALWPLHESAYRVYVSDIALEGDTGFTVRTHLSVSSVRPDFVYPYAAGVELAIEGAWFASTTTVDMLLVARANGGTEQQQYHVPFEAFTNTTISALAPDLSWMAETGGTLTLHVLYGLNQGVHNDLCTRCAIKVFSAAMTPSIHSIEPFAGQAPMLIRVYGAGFTQLAHSPKAPLTKVHSFWHSGAEAAEANKEREETYITIGSDPCWIVDMLNTLIVCNLSEPCSDLDSGSMVRLVSRTYGSTATAASSKLFFYCTMSLIGISHSAGSVAGGQELTITGMGFPSNETQLSATVAGAPCNVVEATKSAITCITSASPNGGTSTGIVLVRSLPNGRESSCCVYTYDQGITPTLTSISPTEAAPGTRLLLFGTNFPFSDIPSSWRSHTNTSVKMSVLFGYHSLEVTAIQSSTRASVTIPGSFFGHYFLSVYVPQVGNSAKFREQMLTVLMKPSMIVPSVGGFRGRTVMRFVGTAMGANRSADELNALFDIFVCGRRCLILDASEAGEVRCLTPVYMDDDFVAQYRALLKFPAVASGFKVHVLSSAASGTATVVNTASSSPSTVWTDVTTFFNVSADDAHVGATRSVFSSINITSPEVSILLEARLHSRLLLYNVMLFLAPSVSNVGQLDLTSATCRLHLATVEAETFYLFAPAADPANESMWRAHRHDESSDFTWPSLQIGANSLNFNSLDVLPSAAYIRITCEGLPMNILELQQLTVNGYQVGLDAAGGRCPVNIVARHRQDQPGMSSCVSRTGESCPLFYYHASLTPVVMRYKPTYALASDVGARVTLYGTGFGDDIGAIYTILLDKALCTPVSVTDGKLVCAMEGRVSCEAEWQVLWTSESGRGEAMLLSAQPFYAAVAWSSYLAWRGEGLPVEGQTVVIPRSNTILLDTTPPPLTGMLLYGVLIISDEVDIELRLGLLAVSETGALIAGSAEYPHTHKFTITLSTNLFQDSPQYYVDDIDSLSKQREPYLDKMLEVVGGTLQLHGTLPTVATARLAVSANAGDSMITVDRWVPWSVGDTIALVTKSDPNPHHVEKRVIVHKVANVSHTVLHFGSDAPLGYRHIGEDDLLSFWQNRNTRNSSGNKASRAGMGLSASEYALEVGTDVVYLTRTICVRGDVISSVSAVGGTLWMINTTTSQLSHVEMYRTGKRGTKQTYSVWLQGIRYPADSVVMDDVVIHDAYFRGIVLQETRHIVLNRVTVLYADGFGVASIGAGDESTSIQNSSFIGLYGGSGGTDTVPAGLFLSSTDVALCDSEICVSDGHGVWFALRFLYVLATVRACPAQSALATIKRNRIHHIAGNGFIVYPLQFKAGDRCRLSINGTAANDPAAVNEAEMLASVAYSPKMRSVGTLQQQVIFSCGLHGVYLPPSSGYVLESVIIMDCARASLFVDYTTNTTVVHDTFFSGVLPDGTCSVGGKSPWTAAKSSSDSEGDGSGRAAEAAEGCFAAERTGLQAQHGGYLSLFSLRLGHFGSRSSLRLATLSVPSSQATTYPSGSFAALRSAHLTIRFFNFTVVDGADLKVTLAGNVAMIDVDGQATHSNVTSFLFFGGPASQSIAPNCVLLTPEDDTVGDLGSSDVHAGTDVASSATATLSTMRSNGVFIQEPLRFLWSWVRGFEKTTMSASGKAVATLSSASSDEKPHSGKNDGKIMVLHNFSNSKGGSGTSSMNARNQSSLKVCIAPSKRLSLLFANISRVDTSAGSSDESWCSAVTIGLHERDKTGFVIDTNMSRFYFGSNSAEASAVSFYVLTEDNEVSHGEAALATPLPIEAYAAWHSAVESTNTTCGKAGYYTLESGANLTLAFRTVDGAPCYPSALSISVDPSLSWPTTELIVHARVSPSASYFEQQDLQISSLCPACALVGTVSWSSDPISDHLVEISERGESVAPHITAPASTALLSLACHKLPGSITAAFFTSNGVTTTSCDPLESSSLWAAVEIKSCGSNDDRAAIGCIGPYFPHLRRLVTSNTTEPIDNEPSSFTSWYSATAWAGGVAPWNVNLSDMAQKAGSSASPAWYRDAYVIPFGTRVNLILANATHVDGVLLVVGELFITTTAAATGTPRPRASTAADPSSAASDSCLRLSITTLVVLGKLNVSFLDENGPRMCMVLGAENASIKPYRLDVNTLVYPGTLYASGEVTLSGATSAPTVWTATSMVRRSTTGFPTCTSLADLSHLQDWCELHARWAVGDNTYHNTSTQSVEGHVSSVLETLQVTVAQCLKVTQDFLPSWMQWTPSLGVVGTLVSSLVSWKRGDRVGLTSGSSSLYEAEERTIVQDINGSRAHTWMNSADATAGISVTTASVDGDAVLPEWTWPHGRDYARDETRRLPGYGVPSEVVSLTKTVELDCAVPRSTPDRGCMILITRQRHPQRLLGPPRFRARGVSVRHFGKGGQLRGSVVAVKGVDSLTFMPAMYVNVSAARGERALDRTLAEEFGYASLAGSVIEKSYGTALYTDQQNTNLFLVDSAVWSSEGGGVRLDGGGVGVYMEGVVVAGTRYTRAASRSTWQNVSPLADCCDDNDSTLTLGDTEVTSMCSILLNYSHSYYPTQQVTGAPRARMGNATAIMVVAGAFIKNVVAGGSESEGFCLPWNGSGGPSFIGNNTAHSSHVGLFLFHTRLAPKVEPYEAFSQWSSRASEDIRQTHQMDRAIRRRIGGIAGATPRSHHTEIVALQRWLTEANESNVTAFAQWTIYNNRYIGVYSSGHQNVTIASSDIFSNPIGVALAVHPMESSGSSRLLNSYVSTFPRCSCTAAMYGLTTFDRNDKEDAFWHVCQPSAYMKPAWSPKGCGAVTFIDDTYHYAAVLALPSYAYVPLSYGRDTVFTAPSGGVLESGTEGQFLIEGVLFGAVGDLNLCESNVCDTTTTHVTGRALRSAALMGTTGESLRSSASLSSIVVFQVEYAPSCAQILVDSKMPTKEKTAVSSADSNGAADHSGSRDNNNDSSAADTPVSVYRPLSGTAASVVRLWPSPAITSSSAGPAAAALAALSQRIREYCAKDNLCDASKSAAVETLQEAYASPYVMTAVYDMDASLYHFLGSKQIYIPRGATRTSAASQLLAARCVVFTLAETNLFACGCDEVFYQLRLHSTDDRVSRDVAVPLLFTRPSLSITDSTATATTAMTYKSGGRTRSTAAFLQPPEHSTSGSGCARAPSTIDDAVFLSSACQLAMQVPSGVVTINIDPTSYPEALGLHIAACTTPSSTDNMSTLLKIPLMDESVTVHVWSVRTRTILEGVRFTDSTTSTHGGIVSTASKMDEYRSVHWPELIGQAKLAPGENTLWMKNTVQSNSTGVTATSLLFYLPCGERVRVHQLVYASLVLYTSSNANAVTQQMLRYGTKLTVRQLLPEQRYPNVNASYYAHRLDISFSPAPPNPNTGQGMTLIVKIEAVDCFDYNVTAATLLVTEFANLFSAAYSHPNSNGKSKVAGAKLVKRGRGASTKAGTQFSTVDVAGVWFWVLLVIPPLLPSEQHEMQSLLSKVNLVRRGSVMKGPLITLATIVPMVIVLIAVLALQWYVLPVLQHRKAQTAEAQRSASSTIDVSAATVVVEPAKVHGVAFSTAVVVLVAGVLHTTLGATLDKAGITRSADETAEVLHRADPDKCMPGKEVRTHHDAPKPLNKRSQGAASTKVVRQLFLLPNYNAFVGTSASIPAAHGHAAATSVSSFIPHARGGRRVARFSDPQRSQEADQQRYVDAWRLGARAMTLLTHRGSRSRGNGDTGGGLLSSAAASSPFDVTTGGFTSFGSSSTLYADSPRCLAQQSPWRDSLPENAATLALALSSGSAPRDAPQPRNGEHQSTVAARSSPTAASGVNAATTPPERVIPVGMPPSSAAPSSAPFNAQQNYVVKSSSNITPTLTHLPPLPPVLSHPSRATAVLVDTAPLPPVRTANSNTIDVATGSPQTLGATSVGIKSILTTSILAGGSSLAYPSHLVHISGTAPEFTLSTEVGDAAVNGGRPGGSAVTAETPAFGSSPTGLSNDVTLVLRGRGNIMFTTPDSNLEAARALRSMGSITPSFNSRTAGEADAFALEPES